MKNIVELLMMEEGSRQRPISMSFAANEQVEIRDAQTRTTTMVPASEVSLYRHGLVFQNKTYRILNIFSSRQYRTAA